MALTINSIPTIANERYDVTINALTDIPVIYLGLYDFLSELNVQKKNVTMYDFVVKVDAMTESVNNPVDKAILYPISLYSTKTIYTLVSEGDFEISSANAGSIFSNSIIRNKYYIGADNRTVKWDSLMTEAKSFRYIPSLVEPCYYSYNSVSGLLTNVNDTYNKVITAFVVRRMVSTDYYKALRDYTAEVRELMTSINTSFDLSKIKDDLSHLFGSITTKLTSLETAITNDDFEKASSWQIELQTLLSELQNNIEFGNMMTQSSSYKYQSVAQAMQVGNGLYANDLTLKFIQDDISRYMAELN